MPRAEIARLPYLAAFLPDCDLVPFGLTPPRSIDGVIARIGPLSTRTLAVQARRREIPFWTFSPGPVDAHAFAGIEAPPVCLAFEQAGFYRDSRRPSQFEARIARSEGAGERDGADLLRRLAVDSATGRGIALIDQAASDPALPMGLANASDLVAMAVRARRDHPTARIRVVPDPFARAIGGGILARQAEALQLEIADLSEPPMRALEGADQVWTVASAIGFDAALAGFDVHVFGCPWYRGWGLAEEYGDRGHDALARRAPIGHAAFAAAIAGLARFADPVTGLPADFDAAIDRLEDWRGRIGPVRRRYVCIGFAPWKRPFARTFLPDAIPPIRFGGSADPAGAARGEVTCAWGASPVAGGSPVWRMEDGFLRSVGLGSDFRAPASLCIDETGIYYDATRPSDLETLLETFEPDEDLLAQAADLRRDLVARRVTKYNLADPVERPEAAGQRRVVLVVGQVPDDQSIRLGQVSVAGNAGLIAAVRAERPDAFIVYKEHPELVSGNRPGALTTAEIRRHADFAALGGDIAGWLDIADEVHVMTSLAGFEALLRGRPVTAWGMPFYAGWGLTADRVACPRRTRRLSLDHLVAGALLLYPRYADPQTGIPCSAQEAVALLARAREERGGLTPGRDMMRRLRRHSSYVFQVSREFSRAARQWRR